MESKYVSLREIIKELRSETSTAAEEDEESPESDGGPEIEHRARYYERPPFPSRFKNKMKKSEEDESIDNIEFRLLAIKKLCSANIRRNRLTFIGNKMKPEMALVLTAEEEAALNSGTGIHVVVIEPDGEVVNTSFILKRRAHLPIPRMQEDEYSLGGAWSEVVARHKNVLQRGRLVRIWWFRHRDVDNGRRLWFALEVVSDPGDCELAEKISQKWHFNK